MKKKENFSFLVCGKIDYICYWSIYPTYRVKFMISAVQTNPFSGIFIYFYKNKLEYGKKHEI